MCIGGGLFLLRKNENNRILLDSMPLSSLSSSLLALTETNRNAAENKTSTMAINLVDAIILCLFSNKKKKKNKKEIKQK